MRSRPLIALSAVAAFSAAALSAMSLAGGAWGQTPPSTALTSSRPAVSPEQRQRVVDLAYVLGEAHALHRVCAGDDDNTWRGRMSRLIQVEAPDAGYRQRLLDSFNAGFLARNAEFPKCTLKTAEAERRVAERGRDLSRRISAGVSANVAP